MQKHLFTIMSNHDTQLKHLKPKSITENQTKAFSLFSTRLAVIKEREAEVRII